MTIDPDEAGKWVVIGLGTVIAAVKYYLRDRWDESRSARKADQAAAASVDVAKVLLDHDKAHLEELDNLKADHKAEIEQYEVREVNLEATIAELLRQSAEAARLHTLAIEQLTADRDADRAELRRLNQSVRDLEDKLDEQKAKYASRELEILEVMGNHQHKVNELEAAMRALRTSRSTKDEEIARLRRELEDKERRGYHAAKVAEKASPPGPFTATDVFPDGKPRP